jgi:hypothetical protein
MKVHLRPTRSSLIRITAALDANTQLACPKFGGLTRWVNSQQRGWLAASPRNDASSQERPKCVAAKGELFDYLVGGHLQCQRQVEAERLGGSEIDNEFEFRRAAALADRMAFRP